MKIIKQFAPISIEIETEEDLKNLRAILVSATKYENSLNRFSLGHNETDLLQRIRNFQNKLY